MDNGYMRFNQCRIPHEAMLSNYSRVDPNTCTYSTPANPAVVYGTLTAIRANIIIHARLVLARAVTVAVRYTSIGGSSRTGTLQNDGARLSDRPDSDTSVAGNGFCPAQLYEALVLEDRRRVLEDRRRVLEDRRRVLEDRRRVLEDLHYTGEAMQQLYEETRADLSKDDFSKLAVLHSQSSGLKSLCTELVANGIETCRRALGGHGFGGGSGLIQLNNDYLSKPTVEGDNWMITQQTASYLIKGMAAAASSTEKAEDAKEEELRGYLNCKDRLRPMDLDLFRNDAHIVDAFHRRSRDTTYRAYCERYIRKQKWNSLLLQLRKVSQAESQAILVSNFYKALSDGSSRLSSTIKAHLATLFRLFAFYTMDAEARDFLKANAVSDTDLDRLPSLVQELMAQIRPHAVNLVDAWSIPDFLLDSALGRYDGHVYEDLFNRAHRLNPLNEVTFNPDYRSDEIVKGSGGEEMKKIIAKL